MGNPECHNPQFVSFVSVQYTHNPTFLPFYSYPLGISTPPPTFVAARRRGRREEGKKTREYGQEGRKGFGEKGHKSGCNNGVIKDHGCGCAGKRRTDK